MSSEAGFGPAAVRYASVGAGFRGPSGPPTVAEPATDGHGQAYGRARTSPRTGRRERLRRPSRRFLPSDLLLHGACSSLPSPSSAGSGWESMGAEGVVDPPVGRVGLPVNAV